MGQIYQSWGPEGFRSYSVEWGEGGPIFESTGQIGREYLIPGFVDLHLHGAYGIDTMSATAEQFEALARGLSHAGYEGFLATTATASVASVKEVLNRLPSDPEILGLHLEGPFISRDYPGAQQAADIEDAPSGPSDWDSVLEDPRLKVVTLAPEGPHALDLVSRLMKRGVIVSLGHTAATYDEARRAFEFGASHATHFFNAMRPMHHRELGIIGYALSTGNLTCELIYDRLHVSREAVGMLLKLIGPDKVIAVSDSTAATAMPPGETIDLWGNEVTIEKGRAVLADGTLAGSVITLQEAFANLANDFGPEIAIQLCCLNPRKALKMTNRPTVWAVLDQQFKLVEVKRFSAS
ncbi:MAG: amidohydrolase family protein [Armatimonadetes bacterium]|nr:amidohydrolase family protein [Armatimonadota bacterium]